MLPTTKVTALACVLTLSGLGALGYLSRIGAQEAPKAAKSARGGALAKTERHQFEVFFYSTGLRVFPRDQSGSSVDAAKLSGNATFYHPNSADPWFSRPLRGQSVAEGRPAESLDLAINLSRVPPTGIKVAIEITGLTDPAEPKVAFTVPFAFAIAPAQAAATNPPFVYGAGAAGVGYYANPSPNAPPARAVAPATNTAPPRPASGGGTGRYRDWTTGRTLRLAKPWLRPMD